MRPLTIAYHFVRGMLVLAAGVAVFVYLVATRPQPQSESRENPGPLVEVLAARLVSGKFTIHAHGTVSPRRVASVVAEIGGRIIERSPRLEEGARFEKGELLLQIDPEDARLKMQQLEGQADQIRAEIAQLEAERRNIEALHAIATRETELARREYERAQDLLKKGTMAQEEADKREKAWLQSRTVFQNQENALRLWPERLRVLKARLAVTEASIREARRDLGRTEVRAPFSGRIEKVNAEVANSFSRAHSLHASGTTRRSRYGSISVRRRLTGLFPRERTEMFAGGFPDSLIWRGKCRSGFPGRWCRTRSERAGTRGRDLCVGSRDWWSSRPGRFRC